MNYALPETFVETQGYRVSTLFFTQDVYCKDGDSPTESNIQSDNFMCLV
jgi:hypothetical protein